MLWGKRFVAVAASTNKTVYNSGSAFWIPELDKRTQLATKESAGIVKIGDGINVNDGVISATGTTYTAGTNIQISSDNIISATNTIYTAGDNVQISDGNVISVMGAIYADPTTWDGTTLPSSAGWESVCYGNDKFVAVATNSNTAAYSTNGINWTSITLPNSTLWYSVCYGKGKFVAIAYNTNGAAYSIDGINWTAITMPSNALWESVCYGGDKFVTIGETSDAVMYTIPQDMGAIIAKLYGK